ncbi:MAG: YbaB/EbfC family nucleoid-associated protein [Terriglobales bacterium]
MTFDMSQLQNLLAQAKRQFEDSRDKLALITAEGSAGAGMVSVRLNGEKQVLEVRLDPDVVKNDPEMLPDLIRAAANEAVRRVDERIKEELGSSLGHMSGLMGGLSKL